MENALGADASYTVAMHRSVGGGATFTLGEEGSTPLMARVVSQLHQQRRLAASGGFIVFAVLTIGRLAVGDRDGGSPSGWESKRQ